jgi:hypothetical protein
MGCKVLRYLRLSLAHKRQPTYAIEYRRSCTLFASTDMLPSCRAGCFYSLTHMSHTAEVIEFNPQALASNLEDERVSSVARLLLTRLVAFTL